MFLFKSLYYKELKKIDTVEQVQKNCCCVLQRMKGVEPSSPAWKAGVIAVIRHPQKYAATIAENAGNVNRNLYFYRSILYTLLL